MARKGQKYKVLRDLEVTAMTSWAAPCTGGERVILPAGEIFIISNDPPETATAVYADPCSVEDYQRMEKMFVPEEERSEELYCGFYLCLYIKDIKESCELLSA